MFKQLIEAICFRLIHGPLNGSHSPEFVISRLDLKPGDIIVLRTKRVVPDHVATRMREMMKDIAPGHRALVIEDGMDIALLTAPSA